MTVKMNSTSAAARVQLIDLSGKLLRTITPGSANTFQLSLQELLPGVYLLWYTDDQRSEVTRFIKE